LRRPGGRSEDAAVFMPAQRRIDGAVILVGVAAMLALSCEGGSAAPQARTMQVIDAFTGTHVYFKSDDNQRKIDRDVAFPDAGPWKEITLRVQLGCPEDKCDWWDRWAYIGVVNGDTRESPVIEIIRFATPFRVGATFTADVTALQPLLQGKRRLRVFIDTWVGPGHANGDGWLVDASFTFVPGTPARQPIAVLPVFDVGSFEAGDPNKPVATSVPPKSVDIPANAGRVELRSFITGHGQGNLDNCAEFCPKTHSYTVGAKGFDHKVWRDDCATTAVQPQGGTWKFPRAGWCPGALAEPWVEDVSSAVSAGKSVMISYSPEPYENTCRPDSPVCAGCVSGACPYDDGQHTAPSYAQSALLVVYGD
jgi:hypothetical protein